MPNRALPLLLVLAGCAVNTPAPVEASSIQAEASANVAKHFLPHSEDDRLFLCMAPNGEWAQGSWSREGRRCSAPARFIEVARCAWEQREAREPAAVRAAAATDQSLIGDVYQGMPICSAPAPF